MCSYCGCRNIPLIRLLTRQHEDITNHTTALREAARSNDRPAAAGAALVLAEQLNPHTHLEERGLFAEMRKDDMFTEHIDSLCAEHEVLDSELAVVAAGDLSRVEPLLTLLANHIDREENGLFPAALTFLDNEQWDDLQETGTPGASSATVDAHTHAPGVPHHH
jgi:hemerythrin-like domain-containing protein